MPAAFLHAPAAGEEGEYPSCVVLMAATSALLRSHPAAQPKDVQVCV